MADLAAPKKTYRPGDVQFNKRTGQSRVWNGQGWDLQKEAAQSGAEQRGRLNMGLGPMVQAEQTMSAMEALPSDGAKTPLGRDWGAAAMAGVGLNIGPVDWHPLDALAKAAGGQDYQDYTQAAKAFEAQLMPIMSGAAVSPSEAKRQIKASLPEFGDSPQNLRNKARDRQMMLNGAAKSLGKPIPYPDVPTYGVNTATLPPARTGGQPRPVTSLPKAPAGWKLERVEKGG